jgi:hypothetical protein
MTQTPTEALATIRDNLRTITDQYPHTEWGEPNHNIITTLNTLHQTLDNLQAEEEQQLKTAVALNAINLDAFHTHILELLSAHFTTLFDNTCSAAAQDRSTKTDQLTEIQNFIAEQALIIQFATRDTEK